jgi:serine phosphatase RsbU (regulator of sigma subunit)
MYTDGVSEARDAAGRYFPLSERATAAAGPGNSDDMLLDQLLGDVCEHIGEGPADDILLLLAAR